MMNRILFLLIFLLVNLFTYSQEHDHHEEHQHPEFELGLSSGLVYNLTENEIAPGMHIHFIKTISRTDKLGLGLGYEAIFDDHKHNAASIIVLYRPIEHLSFNFSPGVSWLATRRNSLKPSMHLEVLYEWEFGNFHMGPLVGLAFNTEDLHISAGLHFALGF